MKPINIYIYTHTHTLYVHKKKVMFFQYEMKKHFEIVLTYIHIDCFLIFSYEILKFQIFF